jgi:Fe-S-cluster containining protein
MIRQLIPEEFCLRCLGCCRFAQVDSAWPPNLSDGDIQELLKGKVPPFFILENKKIRLSYNQNQDNFVCSLLDLKDNKCKAYAFRPLECQLYPFLLNRCKNKVFLALDLKCPFAKKKHKDKIFKEYAQYLAGFLNSPDILKVLKNNLQIIQEYKQVSNIIALDI